MLHKKVQIVLINRQKQTLVLFQVNKDRGGFWQNITGSVEPGEDILQAAQRELLEESGITTDNIIDLNFHFHFHDQWNRDVEEYCFVALSEKTPVLSCEHQKYKELKLDEVHKSDYKFENNFQAFLTAKEIIHA
jgi:8-oxo-dGTP pyrophosphatase MutT (NUDIX family)